MESIHNMMCKHLHVTNTHIYTHCARCTGCSYKRTKLKAICSLSLSLFLTLSPSHSPSPFVHSLDRIFDVVHDLQRCNRSSSYADWRAYRCLSLPSAAPIRRWPNIIDFLLCQYRFVIFQLGYSNRSKEAINQHKNTNSRARIVTIVIVGQ